MKLGSLLWLENSRKIEVNKEVINNLNLEILYSKMVSKDDILYQLCEDLETIIYRQDIFEDFMNNDGLMEDLVSSLTQFYNLEPFFHKDFYSQSGLYRIIDIVRVMEQSIKSLLNLGEILDYYSIKSEGLQRLQKNVEVYIATPKFKEMKKDLKEIKYIFSQIKGVVLSVNLNTGLRPIFAQVTGVFDHQFKYPKAFRKISDILKSDRGFLGDNLFSYTPVFKVPKLNYDLLEEIEYALRSHKKTLQDFLKKYDKIEIKQFVELLNEVNFYESGYKLFEQLKQLKLPLCKPDVKLFESGDENDDENEKSLLTIFEGYNINLAIEKNPKDVTAREDIILNDFKMTSKRKSYIITGANRGGKTTYTQMIGQIQLLAQLGLYVPAKVATVTMVDGIFTHFPRTEKESMDTGKFGKECQLFVEMFKACTPKSLMLLNESFAGTSHLESLNIASQGVRALIEKQVPFVFNTHLHSLYEEVLLENKQVEVVSLITDTEEGETTYHLIEKPPTGKSYARKIALKYGVTYEQLIGGLNL